MRRVLILVLIVCGGCAPPEWEARQRVLDACGDDRAVVLPSPGSPTDKYWLCRKRDGSLWLYEMPRLILGGGPTGVMRRVTQLAPAVAP